jgi:hypothetical protein
MNKKLAAILGSLSLATAGLALADDKPAPDKADTTKKADPKKGKGSEKSCKGADGKGCAGKDGGMDKAGEKSCSGSKSCGGAKGCGGMK